MSQYPPPPGGQFGQTGYGDPPPPPRGNGFAVASLVLGIVGCVPFVTSLLAIVFGLLGLRKTRDPAVGGRGLAIAGLILGVLGVLGWSGFGGLIGFGYMRAAPAKAVAERFLREVSEGNISAAAADSAGITTGQLQANSDAMGRWGTFQDASFSGFSIQRDWKHTTTVHLSGTATFSSGSHACTFDLVKQGNTYKVSAYSVQ